jgi:uncharacterized protein YggE
VAGIGTSSAEPDVGRIALVAAATRPSVSEAVAAEEEAARGIREALLSHGIAGADAATSRLRVYPTRTYRDDEPGVTVFHAEQGVAVTVRDLSTLGPALADALAAGGDESGVEGIEFAVDDPAPLRVRAREAAWADAVARAQQLARLCGRPLGPVLHVSEAEVPGNDRPTAHEVMRGGSTAAVSATPGRVEISVSLRVHWALGPHGDGG